MNQETDSIELERIPGGEYICGTEVFWNASGRLCNIEQAQYKACVGSENMFSLDNIVINPDAITWIE